MLNLAWVSHFLSQAGHLVYWSHADGQTVPGMLFQMIPFIASIACGVAAGCIQNAAERKLRKAQPGKFPPKFTDWINAAMAAAKRRYFEEGGRRTCCWRCKKRFLRLLREELREQKRNFDRAMQSFGGKGHGLTGIRLAGSSQMIILKDSDTFFDELALGQDSVTLEQMSDYLVKGGHVSAAALPKVFAAINTNGDGHISREEWRVGFEQGLIPGHASRKVAQRGSSTQSEHPTPLEERESPAAGVGLIATEELAALSVNETQPKVLPRLLTGS